MAFLKYLLPIFFIAYSFGEILRIRLFSSVTAGLLDLVLLSIVIAWLIWSKKKEYFLKKPILIFLAIALFSLIINISKFNSQELLISSLYLVRFALYAGIYFVFVDIGKTYKNIIPKYMFLSGVLVTLIGFLQYFLYPNLKNLYYLGWDEHLNRLFSSFLDPNFAGTFLVLFFVFLFILKDQLFKSQKNLIFIILILNFIAIILTYSRGAMLMFVICVVIYSALTKNWKLTGGVVFLFAIVFLVLSPKFGLESTNLLRFASVEARIGSSKTALMVWEKNPFGVGFNTYRYAREKYGDIDTSQFGPSHGGAGVDNSFILVLVTTGISGLLAYIYLLYKMFKLGFSKIKENKFALILIVSLGGLVINGLFINSLFYSFIMLWIWMLIGLTESNSRG